MLRYITVTRVLLTTALFIMFLPLWSAYLTFMPTTVTQPDGSKLECFASGDEYHNWLHDKDGYTIIQSQTTGFYTYAVRSGSQIVAGDLIAGRGNPAMRGLSPNINISKAAYKELRESRFQFPDTRDAPTTGTINNLVVYVRFSGEAEFGQTIATYDGWFNSSVSSQKNYFLEASYNQLTVNTTFYPAASGGNVVSWQDSHTRGYFQPYNASTNTIGYRNDTELQDREFTLLAAAIAGVAAAVPADLVIDADSDGNVDNVVFIVSGASGGWSDLLWPHRWSIYDRTVSLRGKRVYDFNFQLRDFLNTNNVGVICHEFFHTLGAPDLYHYNESVFTPVGSWDLMENNTNPPQHMGAYMKWKYGDWIASIPTITTSGSFTLNPLTSSTGNCYRINSPYSASEYFVVEYRRKTGTYENSLPGSGLLVYRINTGVGDGNAEGPPDEVYIYRPGGTTSADGTISTAHFSSTVGRTAINATTNPAPFLTSGAAGGLSLFNIGAAGTTISFSNGVSTPATITWTPSSISKTLSLYGTTSQTLTIGNTGNLSLNYTAALPATATTVLNEGFENGGLIPSGWTQQNVSGTAVAWTFATGGSSGNPVTAQSGTYNAKLYKASTTATVTRLYSPSLNLSGASSASLTFWHTQALWSPDQDELRVYYRTSSGGTWTLLSAYTNNITAWTMETIALPNLTGTYYIGFEGTAKYGYGVCVDNVMVVKQSTTTTPWLSLNGVSSVSGSIADGGANQSITVGFNTAGLSAGTYNSTITITSNSTANPSVSIPVTLIVNAPAPQAVAFAEGFEAGIGDWIAVNGNQTNAWARGTAASHTGAYGLYISNNGGTGNAYTVTSAAISHVFRDVSFPAGSESYKLRFAWKGQGEAADYLRVYLADTSTLPAAGTALSRGPLGSSYNLSSAWQEVTLDVPAGVNGSSKRLVFSWVNNASAGTQAPAAIDNIRIVAGDQSDAAVIINEEVDITPPPTTDPEANPIAPSIAISGLTGEVGYITVTTGYASVGAPYADAGLDLVFSGVDFAGATMNIIHNLGFIPSQLAYKIGDGESWIVLFNPGSWTDTDVSFTVPGGGKGANDVYIVFSDSEEGTLPVTLSSFTAALNGTNGVRLVWVTATETGVLGYYIYRAISDDLASAIKVSQMIGGTNTSTQQSYLFNDTEVEDDSGYYYWLEGLDVDGGSEVFGPIAVSTLNTHDTPAPVMPLVTELSGNYPNPFNPATTISYTLDKAATVSISIYNNRGQCVKTHTAKHSAPGFYSLPFEAKDMSGHELSSGIYYCRMTIGNQTFTRKMMLMK